MMSEKRFTIEESENQLIIFDNGVSDETYFHLGNDERDVKYVCDLLNEQQEHITYLEDTNDNFRIKLIEDIEAMEQAEKKIGEQQATINRLEEENEQLKQSNDRFADTVAKQVSLLIELRKENEQLRQIIKDIVCATDETYTKNTSMFKVTVVFDGKMYNQIRSCLYE